MRCPEVPRIGGALRGGRHGLDAHPAAPSLGWWLWLAISTPLLCFVVTAGTFKSWSSHLHTAARSISTNGAPSVLYLSNALNDVRLIERRAMMARPEALPVDRAVIGALRAEFDRFVAAERETPDYPGELEAYQVMAARSDGFFAAVDALLAGEAIGLSPSAEALARVKATTDMLADATQTVMAINASEVEAAGQRIEALEQRGALRDALALICILGGTLVGVCCARRYQRAAEEAHRRDGERLDELDVFAGRVAHDLRSPLQAIQMRCYAGERARTLEGAESAFAQVAQQTRRMSAIIDALLAFARAAAHPEPGSRTEVAAVVAEVIDEAQPPATEARIELVVEPVLSAAVACDPAVLAVILSNLVHNAIKYAGDGREGRGRITLRERRQGSSLRFEVEDSGPGIPPGDEARVFDPFVRLAGRRVPEGIGLGLATVKRLVEANRGEVGVVSQPGRGCCFWFTLPLAA